MALPEPTPGLVIRYAYLWRSEAECERDEATKDRPCAVVIARQIELETLRVWVAPVTHTAPQEGTAAVEIPSATKQRLGLDQERSWIVTNEMNSFTWPGPDIRPVPTQEAGAGRRFAYGFLPRSVVQLVLDSIKQEHRQGRSKIVGRDEAAPQQGKAGQPR